MSCGKPVQNFYHRNNIEPPVNDHPAIDLVESLKETIKNRIPCIQRKEIG